MAIFPDFPALDIVEATPEEREKIGKKWLYELVEDYTYIDPEMGFQIVVPKGFRHDGASVPRLGFTISGLTPDGPIRHAALVHDWLYRWDGFPPEGSTFMLREDGGSEPFRMSFTREQADKLFARIMKRTGIRSSQVFIAYWAVRIGGRRWKPPEQ